MSGQTPINIVGYTVDDNINDSDTLLNIPMYATLVLLGNDVLTDDSIVGSGRVSVRGATTIDDGLTLGGTTLFVDMSFLAQNGDLVLGQSSSDAVTARNIAGATWELGDDTEITGVGGSQFVNLGLLEQTGGTTTVNAVFYDREGTIQIDGTLDFSGGRFVNDTIEGSGTFEVESGAFVGSTVSTAYFDATFAQFVGDVTISSNNIYIDDPTLIAGANLTLSHPTATISLNFVSGSGEIEIMGDSTFYTYSPQSVSGSYLSGAITFENLGNTKFTGSGHGNGFVITATGRSVLENQFGATWTDTGGYAEVKADFMNSGTFIEDTEGSASFSMPVKNNGVMEFGPDTETGASLNFSGALSGTGIVELGLGDVDVEGSVSDDQTFQFLPMSAADEAPSLTIGNLRQFAGTISGFDQNGETTDQLIVKQPTGWQFEDFVASSEGTGGSLIFTNGSASASVNLVDSYQPNNFHSDVSGDQTTITYGT